MLNGLDLFSGIGGNTLGLRDYIKTVAYCEFDRHAQSVLLSRMGDGSIEPAPIWDDITTLTADKFDIPIDIIIGGFPCQDISVAGKGAGITENTRSGLFFQVARLARELKPRFLFLENVPAIRTRGLDIVLQELTEIGYDCRWAMLSAAEVGANHGRERWFLLGERREIMANARSKRYQQKLTSMGIEEKERKPQQTMPPGNSSPDMAISKFKSDKGQGQWWEIEPNVGRVVDEFPLRLDRLKRLGNAVVPLQAKTAFEILMFKRQ